jgi:hypothetical protein
LFEDAEDDNIKTLIDMCGVGWITENMDFVCVSEVKELEGIMGVMAIDNEEAGTAICLPRRMFLKVGKPEYGQFTVCPSFLRIAKPFICG